MHLGWDQGDARRPSALEALEAASMSSAAVVGQRTAAHARAVTLSHMATAAAHNGSLPLPSSSLGPLPTPIYARTQFIHFSFYWSLNFIAVMTARI